MTTNTNEPPKLWAALKGELAKMEIDSQTLRESLTASEAEVVQLRRSVLSEKNTVKDLEAERDRMRKDRDEAVATLSAAETAGYNFREELKSKNASLLVELQQQHACAQQEHQKAANGNENELKNQATAHLAELATPEKHASQAEIEFAIAYEALRLERTSRCTVEDKLPASFAKLEEQGRTATALMMQVRKLEEERNKLVERLEARDVQLHATRNRIEQLQLQLPTVHADVEEETAANNDSLVRASKLFMHVSTYTFEQINFVVWPPFPLSTMTNAPT